MPGAWIRTLAATFAARTGYWGMKFLLAVAVWGVLLVLCWPVALLLVLMLPVLWLLALPFRVVGYVLEAVLALLKAILFLPARLLGAR